MLSSEQCWPYWPFGVCSGERIIASNWNNMREASETALGLGFKKNKIKSMYHILYPPIAY